MEQINGNKITKLVVLGLIKNDNDEVLIAQRFEPDNLEAHLKWDLPGGTNEFGESLEKTVIREVGEETGINIKVLKLLPKSTSKVWQYDHFEMHVVVLCYYCQYLSGDISLGDPKINNLKWTSINELSNYDFLPTTKCFVDMAINKES